MIPTFQKINTLYYCKHENVTCNLGSVFPARDVGPGAKGTSRSQCPKSYGPKRETIAKMIAFGIIGTKI